MQRNCGKAETGNPFNLKLIHADSYRKYIWFEIISYQLIPSYLFNTIVSSSSRTFSDLALQPSPPLYTPPLLPFKPFPLGTAYITPAPVYWTKSLDRAQGAALPGQLFNLNMKLLVISALLVLAVCAVSAEEDTFLSSSINYVQDLASDVASKTTDAINQVKELPLAQQAIGFYDSGSEYVSTLYTSVMKKAMEGWDQLTTSF
ncbi:apolipoprotein C-III [Rhinoderma darwinii]|uniref:apolipoprotein C-III n=1 Tax=Rhinoderma darwinii TaxID=43563 RepID=UPI003F6759AD